MEMQGAAARPGFKRFKGCGIAIGHASGVRVNGSLSRRFLRFLGLTATTWLRVVVAAGAAIYSQRFVLAFPPHRSF